MTFMVGCGKNKTETIIPTIEPITPTLEPTPVPTPTPIPTPQPTPEPTPTPTPSPIPTPINYYLPSILKNPTDETVYEGDSCYFVAKYENATIATWHFLSPDGQTDLTYIAAMQAFKPLEVVNGMYSTVQLKHIPLSLSGWRVYCHYTNEYGSSSTKTALITVIPRPQQTPNVTMKPDIVLPGYSPTPVPIEPDPITKFYNSAEKWAINNINYLSSYGIDKFTCTLFLKYNVSREVLNSLITDDNSQLVKNIINTLHIDLSSIQNIAHCVVTISCDNEDYCMIDLITNQLILTQQIYEQKEYY